MSITKDFEEKLQTSGGHAYYHVHHVTPLLAHARALEGMLKKHEFTLEDFWCPECGGRDDFGHTPDCQLAKLLEGV